MATLESSLRKSMGKAPVITVVVILIGMVLRGASRIGCNEVVAHSQEQGELSRRLLVDAGNADAEKMEDYEESDEHKETIAQVRVGGLHRREGVYLLV